MPVDASRVWTRVGPALLGAGVIAGLGAALLAAAVSAQDREGDLPAAGAEDFHVFVAGDAVLGGEAARGAVMIGGDLVPGGDHQIAAPGGGTFSAPGDNRPVSLAVGGVVDWEGQGADVDAVLTVSNQGYVKIGDLAGTSVESAGGSTRLVPDSGAARVQLGVVQARASVGADPGLDIPALTDAYRDLSVALDGCESNTVLVDQGNGTVEVTPSRDVQNVARVDISVLTTIDTFDFTRRPTADGPLVVNVTTSDPAGVATWEVPRMTGLANDDAAHIVFNFIYVESLVIDGGANLRAAVLAPRTELTKRGDNAILGAVTVATLDHRGDASGSGGSIGVHRTDADIAVCTPVGTPTPTPTGVSTAVPPGTPGTPTSTPTVTPTGTPPTATATPSTSVTPGATSTPFPTATAFATRTPFPTAAPSPRPTSALPPTGGRSTPTFVVALALLGAGAAFVAAAVWVSRDPLLAKGDGASEDR